MVMSGGHIELDNQFYMASTSSTLKEREILRNHNSEGVQSDVTVSFNYASRRSFDTDSVPSLCKQWVGF